MTDPYQAPSKRKMLAYGVGGTLGALALIFVLMTLGGVITVGGAGIQGKVDQMANPGREKSILFNPNNSIGTYEQFYDDCRAVVALNAKIDNMQRELRERSAAYNPKADSFGNEQKAIGSLRTNITGLRNQQADVAEQYNAKSSQTTRAQFKAADLPYTIDLPYEDIECGSPKEANR